MLVQGTLDNDTVLQLIHLIHVLVQAVDPAMGDGNRLQIRDYLIFDYAVGTHLVGDSYRKTR